MTLWVAIGGLTLVAICPILWPLLRPPKWSGSRLDHDLEVYRDQLREVEAELRSATLTEKEASEAKRDIERRILRAAQHETASIQTPVPSAITAVVIALLLPGLTLMLYMTLGQPDQPDQPIGERAEVLATTSKLVGNKSEQINQMVLKLADRLREDPDDLNGWILLGRTQAALANYADAAKSLRRAVDLSKGDADLQVAYSDVLIKSAGGLVTPEALLVIKKALVIAPRHIAGRYFEGLAELQAGRPKAAYNSWVLLYQELPNDSDNRLALAEQIRRVAKTIGINVENKLEVAQQPNVTPKDTPPGPSRSDIEAAADMSATDRSEFIKSMVQRLADRLVEEPGDFSGWMRLAKAYTVLKQFQNSADAYGRAAKLKPSEPEILDAQAVALIKASPSDRKLSPTAIAVLRRLEKLQPNNPRVLWFLGMLDANQGRGSAAIKRWQRLLDLSITDAEERQNIKAAIERFSVQK